MTQASRNSSTARQVIRVPSIGRLSHGVAASAGGGAETACSRVVSRPASDADAAACALVRFRPLLRFAPAIAPSPDLPRRAQ